jgi:hypothetical protein
MNKAQIILKFITESYYKKAWVHSSKRTIEVSPNKDHVDYLPTMGYKIHAEDSYQKILNTAFRDGWVRITIEAGGTYFSLESWKKDRNAVKVALDYAAMNGVNDDYIQEVFWDTASDMKNYRTNSLRNLARGLVK